MKLAITTSGFVDRVYGSDIPRDPFESAMICRAAGFHYLDMNAPTYGFESGWFDKVKALRDRLADEGVRVWQSHAPMNRYKREDFAVFDQKQMRAVEAAKAIGAEYIVFHADEYRAPDFKFDPEVAFEFEYKRLVPIVEHATEFGIKVAIENTFDDCGPERGHQRFTAEPDELISLVERFNAPDEVVCCWDFGHASVTNFDMTESLKKLAPYVKCLHVHDNYHWKGGDWHLPPFLGKTDWKAQMDILRSAGFDGAFNVELVYGNLPDPILVEYLRFVYKACEYITCQLH